MQLISVPSPLIAVLTPPVKTPTFRILQGGKLVPVQSLSAEHVPPLLHCLPADSWSGDGAIARLMLQSVDGVMLKRVLSNWMAFWVA